MYRAIRSVECDRLNGAARLRGRHSLGIAIAIGFGLVVSTLIAGSWILLERTQQTALHAADTTLQNAALIVESVVNRQFLQVDGALASLPALFATLATDGSDFDPQSARRLLHGLNFQTFAFRDILLVRPDGAIWASARANSWNRGTLDLRRLNADAGSGAAVVAGPIRNPATGDWVLLVVRQVDVPGVGLLDAIAESPVPLIAKLLSSVAGIPGLRVSLERRDGQLLLSQPYDEARIGKQNPAAISQVQAGGATFVVPRALNPRPTIGIVRASLYNDVMIALTLDMTTAMADWVRERDRMIVSVGIVVILVTGLAFILIAALRQRERTEQRIRYVVHHDALTKLPNRVLFRQKLEDALANTRPGEQLVLLYLDLDGFKTVNDTLGHPVGDALLQAVARRLEARTRNIDIVARLGGDEFAIARAATTSPADAADFAARIIALLDEPFSVHGHQITIGTSVGITLFPQDGTDPDELLKCAGLALYRAKQDGRGVYRLFQQDMDAEMQARRLLEIDLRAALGYGQLELFYQPLIDLRTQTVVGFEALLRWRHPDRGLVPPDQFIPLAEEIGAIVPIGEWVLLTACTTAAGWPDSMKVAVNLSPVQFKSDNLVAAVRSALRGSGLAPRRLELEITETVMLQDTAATLATLHEFHAIGASIAMDDFGTGYSSLGYLRRFPFDRIKIDQSFVRELGRQQDCDTIVRAVTALSHALGMETTAEGVETVEQLRALTQAGCTVVQGYLFSRPVPESAIMDLLSSMPTIKQLLHPDATALAQFAGLAACSGVQ
jgi:diguanylate cyclase (GGDEF)-like protein